MTPRTQALCSIALGVIFAGILALILAYLWPVEQEPITIWNWDRWTRFR